MKSLVLPISILALAASLLVAVYLYNSAQVFGSVTVGQEYNFVELTSADVGTTTIKTLPGAIGSFVVENPSAAATIKLYATTSQATSSADLIFSFDAAASEGTYTYDVSFGKGILMDIDSAFNGDVVFTYR